MANGVEISAWRLNGNQRKAKYHVSEILAAIIEGVMSASIEGKHQWRQQSAQRQLMKKNVMAKSSGQGGGGVNRRGSGEKYRRHQYHRKKYLA